MVEQQLDIEENPTFWKDHNVQVGECVDVLRFSSFLNPCGAHIVIGIPTLDFSNFLEYSQTCIAYFLS